MAEDWRSAAFRQSVVAKIDEAITSSGTSTVKNSHDMEKQVFEKAKSKEEYLSFVARLILHVRELNTKKGVNAQGGGGGVGAGAGGSGGGGQAMPDPINALQTLARQGTGNNQMMGMGGPGGPGGPIGPGGGGAGGGPMGQQPNASSLLQNLTQRPGMGRPGAQGTSLGQLMSQNQNPMAGGQLQGQMPGQMQNQMGGQMAGQIPGQMANQMGGQMPNQMGGQMSNQMGGPMPGQMPGQIPNQMGGQIGTQMQNQMGAQMSSQIGGQMSVQMSGQMPNQMGGQMQNQMGGQMSSQMGGQLIGQMSGQMGGQLQNQLSQMTGQIGNQIQSQLQSQLQGQMANQMQNPMSQMGQLPNQMQNQMPSPMNTQIPNQMLNQISGSIPGQMPNQMGGQMPGQLPGQMGGQMHSQLSGQMPNQLQGQLAGQMPNGIAGQMPGQINALQSQMGGPISAQIPNQMGNQMGPQLGAQMGNQLVGQLGSPMANQVHLQQRKYVPEEYNLKVSSQSEPGNTAGADGIMMNQGTAGFVGPRAATPSQFHRQSPTPNVQSPAGMGSATAGNQMAASPALSMAPSPSSMQNPPRNIGMAPSPSSSLSTPVQSQATPSPCSSSQKEDQAYRDKLQQMTKYVEPLRRMVSLMGKQADSSFKTKVSSLLNILQAPHSKRIAQSIDVLHKCQIALEKMDLTKFYMNQSQDTLPITPLLDATNTTLQTPMANHTLQRTFGTPIEALFGPEIKSISRLKKRKLEEEPKDIPEVLQGEIARLDQRFKVSLDPAQQPGAHSVQLLCVLEDRSLPCVPPILVSVPENYPASSPHYILGPYDYTTTSFLKAVQEALEARVRKLPTRFSVSQLLDTWEISVRQACAPTKSTACVTTTAVLLGL